VAKILLGVAGSIAAYKSPDLVKELKAQGHELRVVLTSSAKEFVTPKTLETFLGARLQSNDVWSEEHLGTEHIEGARWADVILIYGTTANLMAKLAHGFCDDFLSLQVVATTAPVVLVPAMNVEMWNNAATQENLKTLQQRAFKFVGPVEGTLACGEFGKGHVASFEEIQKVLSDLLFFKKKGSFFSGKKVLLSAGSMKTAIDEVRYLQNASSGKMGLEMTKALLEEGANVTLLAGLFSFEIEREFELLKAKSHESALSVLRFEKPGDYRKLIEQEFPRCVVFFSAAAILDFEVKAFKGKLPREETRQDLKLDLIPVEDFVAKAHKLRKTSSKKQHIVAFALESGSWDDALARAQRKLHKKGADTIVVNRSGVLGEGPYANTNKIALCYSSGEPPQFFNGIKEHLATQLLGALSERLTSKNIDVSLNC
jgi:phosphopantothenoylcysteine decarboxylase/phosphopantothenate--cysteine ligase